MNPLRIGVIESIKDESDLDGLVSENLILRLDASRLISYVGYGTSWFDISKNDFDATLINGPLFSSENGGIITHDGINDYCQIPHKSDLSINTETQKTIQIWFRPHTLPTGVFIKPIVGKLSNLYGFDGYWVGFNSLGVLRTVTNGRAGQRVSSSASKVIFANQWHFLTAVLQISGIANSTKAYINNTEVISTSHGVDTIDESNPFNIGFIGTGVNSQYFHGDVGAVFFYDRGLSPLEITQNYEATKKRFDVV